MSGALCTSSSSGPRASAAGSRHDGPPERGGDPAEGQLARCGEINRAAVDFGVHDRADQQPKRVVEVDHLHGAIGRLESANTGSASSRRTQLSTLRPR